MRNLLGVVVLLGGVVMVIAGFIYGASGVSIPGNVLGLYSPVTAICVYGGAVVAFCGFALMVSFSTTES